MALADALGAVDPQAMTDDMLRQNAPQYAPYPGPVDPQDFMDRMIRDKVYGQGRSRAPDGNDLAKLGKTPEGPQDFSKFGRNPDSDQPTDQQATQPDAGAGALSVGARSAGQAVTNLGGEAAKGLARLRQGSAGEQASAENEEMIRRAMGGEDLDQAAAAVQAAPPKPAPVEQQPLYTGGQAIQQFGQKTFPVSDAERAAHPIAATVGGAIGGVGAGLALGAVDPAAAVAGTAALFGLSGYEDTYEDAKKKGADDATAQEAAALSGTMQGAIGTLPVANILKPFARLAPQLSGWAMRTLASAAENGVTFATVGEAQEFLGQQIAKIYDPKAGYQFDGNRLIGELVAGGALGVAHGAVAGAADLMQRRGQQPAAGTGQQPQPGTPPGTPPGPLSDADLQAGMAAAQGRQGGPPPIHPDMSDDAILRQVNFPDIDGMSAAEKTKVADEFREKANEDVLRQGGISDEDLAKMSPADKATAAEGLHHGDAEWGAFQKANGSATRTFNPDGSQQFSGTPNAPPSGTFKLDPTASDDDVLRQTSIPEDQIKGMSAADKKAMADAVREEYARRQGGAGEETPPPPPPPGADTANQTHEERVKQYQDFVRQRQAAREKQRQADAQAANAAPADERRRAALERSAAYYDEFSPSEIASWSDEKLKDYVTQKTTKAAPDDEILKRAGVTPDEAAAMSPEEKKATADEARGYGVHAAAEEPPVQGSREAPIEAKTADDVARAAAQANQDHTPEQGEANNVQRGHMRWNGLDVTIEAPAGGVRRGTSPEGEPWETTHSVPYGYIKGTEGADGMHVDAFVGPNPTAPTVYVMDERDGETGAFRQHKAFIGFQSPFEALHAYLGTSTKQPHHVGGMRALSVDEFKTWLKEGDTKAPLSDAMAGGGPEIGPAAGDVDLKVNHPTQGSEPPIYNVSHIDAVEEALRAAAIDPATVDPADIEAAAKIHASEGAPPEDAFPVAVVRRLVADGTLSPDDVAKAIGNEETRQLLGSGEQAQRGVRPETRGAAVGGEAAAPAAELDKVGAEAGAKPAPERGERGGKGADHEGAEGKPAAAQAAQPDTGGGAAGAEAGRGAADHAAGGRRPAANPKEPARAKPEPGVPGPEREAARDAADAALKGRIKELEAERTRVWGERDRIAKAGGMPPPNLRARQMEIRDELERLEKTLASRQPPKSGPGDDFWRQRWEKMFKGEPEQTDKLADILRYYNVPEDKIAGMSRREKAAMVRDLDPSAASAASPENAASAPLIGEKVEGIKEHKVTAADGTSIKTVPVVVEAKDLVTSSDAGYDKALQPRQRERAASQAQIREIATRLDPERLGYSAEADRGAPIVGPDRMVESGNGRVAALRQVYSSSPERAKAYRNWLKSQGVDESRFDQPILVRQRVTNLTPEERRAFTVGANQATTLAMSAPERAAADAKHISARLLGMLEDPANLPAAANRRFVRAFVAALPASERGALTDAQGALSAEGATRVRNAVLAKAYGDADVLSRITESTDDEVKSISNALVAAAPQWAALRADIEAGHVRADVDSTEALMDAVKRTADLRARGDKLADYLAQQDAFTALPGNVESWMRAFYNPTGKRAASTQSIAETLRFYAEQAAKVSADKGLDLGAPELTAKELQNAALAKAQGVPLGGRGAGARQNAPNAGAQARGPERGETGRGPDQAGHGLAEQSDLFTEPTAAGPQGVIPGTERISSAELAQRRANAPLRPKKEQRPLQEGLFGDRAKQEDMFAQATTPRDAFPDQVAKPAPAPQIQPKPKAKAASQASLFEWESPNERPRTEGPGGKALGAVSSGKGQGAQGGGPSQRGAAGGGQPGAGPNRAPDETGLFGPRGAGGGPSEVHPPQAGGTGGAGRAGSRAGGKGSRVSEAPAPGVKPDVKPQEAPSVPALNYRITDETELGKGSEGVKFRDNLAAIETLKKIETENRRATPEEQRALARYVGWGGMANAFRHPTTNEFKPDWKERGEALEALLNKDEISAARHSTPNAHYTSRTVIDAMWKAAQRLGFNGGLTLESSMGTGNFLGLVPDKIAGRTRFVGVELDGVTARIAKALYPQDTVIHSGFQRVPMPDGEFVLSIGNPPFGSESLRFQNKPELSGESIHNQFFLASLDALRPGGLHTAVVSRYLLDANSSIARERMAIKADLLGAIRLPDTAFKENARTEVVTDMVMMQRRTPDEERDMQILADAMRAGGRSEDDKKERARARREFLKKAPWVETDEVRDPLGGEPMAVNSYFAAHPEMVMGRLERSGTMRAGGEVNVKLDQPERLAKMLDEAVKRLPEKKLDTDKELVDRTLDRFKTLSESIDIAMRGLEPGHVEFDDTGRLMQVTERETTNGDFEPVRRPVTPDSPWSRQLMMDAQGRWYTMEPRLDAKGQKVKQGNRLVYDRKYFPKNEVPQSMRLGAPRFERISDLTRLRDLTKQQIVLETKDAPRREMERNRGKLASAYRTYTAKNGLLHEPRNMQLLNEMPDGPLLMSLESGYRPAVTHAKAARSGEKVRQASAKPAAILSERVIPKYEAPTKAVNAADAIAISLSERGRLDPERVASLLGIPEDKIGETLGAGEKPLAFYDPESKTWEPRNLYLSGQVRRKLAAARLAGLEANVRELEAVQPEKWTAAQVTPLVGSNWIPPKVYEDFAKHLLQVDRATVNYSALTNSFNLLTGEAGDAILSQWGTPDMPPDAILRGMLNSRLPKVIRQTNDNPPKRYEDKDASTLVALKAKEIEQAFADWVFKDGDRRRQLVDTYNDKFNTVTPRQHDGSHLLLPGKSPDIALRRHVKNAIWRGIYERNMLVDHVVGAGKTFTAIGRAMERRRMGLSRKPMIVVPNHLVDQWAAEAYRLYPGAKLLAAGKNQFDRKNRRKLFARIATGDWDMVIVPHSSFGFIGISPDTELRFLEDQLRQAHEAVAQAEDEAAASGIGGFRKPHTVKEAERLVSKIEARMDSIRGARRDNMLSFEQMGVDDLTVDEAHEFKNLFYSSRMTGVRGMGDKTGSQKAFDLYNKIKVLNESPTGSVTFLTGTPISNSAVEMYTMMRYLAAKELRELGIEHFDAWRSQYVSAEPKWEPTESGGLKEVTRLGRSWSNMRSLMNLYHSFTDSVTQEDINRWYAEDNNGADFPIPKVAGGGRQTHVVKPTPAQDAILKDVIAGFEHLGEIQDPDERNAERLRLMDRARKVSLDVRAVDPRNPSKEEGGKLEVTADEVARIYKKWNADKGTQLIFLDRSVPKAKGDDKLVQRYDELLGKRDEALKNGDEGAYRAVSDELDKFDPNEMAELRAAQNGGWNAYDQLKRNLVARGIPADEIRFIQEANNDAEKKARFDAVNAGETRVLIGSTARMGAGTNVQERIVALHHEDVTWKPSDIEQREGRGIRQGNHLLDKYGKDFALEIHNYVTERTVDAKMWDLNAEKLRMINGIRKYDGAFNMEFADEDAVSMAEIAALASGDPKLMERVKLSGEIEKLEMQERGFRRKMDGIEDAIENAKRIIREYPERIEQEKASSDDMLRRIEDLRKAVATRRVTVDGKEYRTNYDAAAAAHAAIEAAKGGDENARYVVNVDGQDLTNKETIGAAVATAMGDNEPFEAKIAGETVRRRYAAAKAIDEKVLPIAQKISEGEERVKLGRMLGADLEATIEPNGDTQAKIFLALTDAGKTIAASTAGFLDRMLPSPREIQSTLHSLERDALRVAQSRGQYMQERLGAARKALPDLVPQLKQESPVAAKLAALRDRLRDVITELDQRTKEAEGHGGAPETIGPLGRVNGDADAAADQATSFLNRKGLTWEQAASLDSRHLHELEKQMAAEGGTEPLVRTEMLSPSDIKADPARFQYRGNVVDKASGVTNKPMLPGFVQTAPMVVWRDKAGENFIVDGHHRLNRAKELEAAGDHFKIETIVLRQADGVTPRIAKDFGQRRNEWRERNAAIRKLPDVAAVSAALQDQASSSGGMPSLPASSGVTGVQRPGENSSKEAPPSTQPMPGFQDSITSEPFGKVRMRETPPSILTGPVKVRFSELPVGDIDPTSSKYIIQGTNDINALAAAAEENKVPFRRRLQDIVDAVPGTKIYGVRVKDMPGLLDKVKAKGRPPSTISDFLGGRIIVDTPEAMAAVIADLDRTGGIIEREDFVSEGKFGYRGYHMQVGLGDGTSAELQLVPRGIAEVMDKSHAVRQPVKRILDKPATRRSAEEAARAHVAMAQSQKILDDAWAAMSPAWHAYRPALQGLAEQGPVFYSAVERAVTSAQQDKASPNHWLGMLKNAPGVKDEEMDWLGLPDWLREHKGPVTKSEIAEYIRANQIEVKEVEKGAPSPEANAINARIDEINREIEVLRGPDNNAHLFDDAIGRQVTELSIERMRLEDQLSSSGTQTKFGTYTLPGGENYREMLLTLPENEGGERGPKGWGDTAGGTFDTANFRGPHWEEPNVLAHVRFDDRTIDGQRALHIAEVQSDWHQKGRKQGYDTKEAAADRERAIATASQRYDEARAKRDAALDDAVKFVSIHGPEAVASWSRDGRSKPDRSNVMLALNRMQGGTYFADLNHENRIVVPRSAQEEADKRSAGISDLTQQVHTAQLDLEDAKRASGVPAAPFKTTWPELALKRMVRFAAENGYDTLSWDTGATNAERYDLSKHVGRVTWVTDPAEPSTKGVLAAYDHDRRQVLGDKMIDAAELPDHIGKEAAERLLAQSPERGLGRSHIRTLEGLDLKVGGEGMRGFYDKILPAAAGKLGKKFGAKVERGNLVEPSSRFNIYENDGATKFAVQDNASKRLVTDWMDSRAEARNWIRAQGVSAHPVHTLPITPDLRKAALGGFPLFERGGMRMPVAQGRRLGPFQPSGSAPIAREAQQYVVAQGRATGNEHLIAIDDKGNVAGTREGVSDHVAIDGSLSKAIDDPKQSVVIHHNHPSGYGLSPTDLAMLGSPGLKAVWAHGHKDNVHRAALTPQFKAMAGKMGTPDQVRSAVYKMAVAIERMVKGPIQQAIDQGRVSLDGAYRVLPEVIATAMQRGGLIDYRTNVDVAHLIDNLGLNPFIEKAARAAAGALHVAGFPPVRDDRRAEPLRHLGDVGATLEAGGGIAGQYGEQARPARPRPPAARGKAPRAAPEQLRLLEGGQRFTPPPGAAAGGAGGRTPPPPGTRTATAAPPPRPRPLTGAVAKVPAARAFKNFWTSTFQPELVSDKAFLADPLFAKYKAATVQQKDAIYRESESEWGYWNKRPVPERIRFLDDIETAGFGAVPVDPEQAAMARRYRTMLDANWRLEQQYGSQAAFVQDYFPHVWKKPEEWNAFSETKSAQLGPTWFQKKRTIDYITDGLAAGLELKYTNPVDIVTHRLLSGVDMRQRMQLLFDLKRQGLAWEGAQGGQHLVARGWRAINAPDRKQWVIAPDVQLLWKNAVEAKGLWQADHLGGSIFRSWMALKNVWVPLKLAASAFHPLHVLHINYSDGMARAWGDVVKGRDPIQAIKTLGEGFTGPMQGAPGASVGAVAGALLGSATPIGPYYGGLAGSIAGASAYGAAKRMGMPALPHPGAIARAGWVKTPGRQTPADKANNALMTEGGFVPQLSEEVKIAAARQLAEAWQKVLRKEAGVSDWRKLITASMRRPIEALQRQIFEEWIPNVKTAAYLNEAAAVLRRNPELLNDDDARGVALRGVAQQIDARFGEKFYGSMFWNRYLKDTAIGSFLSLGWNQGFVHQFGGAAMEAVTRPLGLAPPFKPSPMRALRRSTTNKIAFAIAYLGSAALISGLMTLAYTGDMPHGLDFTFPRMGGVDENGNPRRLTTMFYSREAATYMKHVQERGGNYLMGAWEMFTNKLMFEPFKELRDNRDYYGYNIYDENAPFYKQMWQAFTHQAGEQTSPMSVTGGEHAAQLSGKPFPTFEEAIADPGRLVSALTAPGVGESVAGFGPAPAYINKTPIQNRISYLYGEHVAPASRTEEEGEQSVAKMAARTSIMVARQSGDQKALSQAEARGRAAGLTQTYMNNLGKVPSDIYLFSRLPPADQQAILRDASPDEYKRYFPKASKIVKQRSYQNAGVGAAVSQ